MLFDSPPRSRGSSLLSIVVITLVAIMILSAMVALTGAVLLSIDGWSQSTDSLLAAESTADDMLVRLLLDPSAVPTPGESLSFPRATGYPFLTPGVAQGPSTLISRGVSGRYIRLVRVQYTFDSNGKLVIISRQQTQ